MALILCVGSSGCIPFMRVYKTPLFEEIDTSDTAFLISLDPNGKNVGFSTEEEIKKAKINAKRVEIEQVFVQKGYMWYTGSYIPATRLIKVNRTPVTVNWSKQTGIWVESKDSIGFSTGIAMTAAIMNDDDAIKFLHFYKQGSLQHTLDHEIKAQVQRVFAREAAKEPINTLREHKNQIIQAIETDIVPFFLERGITITSLGQFGGFDYQNPKIQAAIDKVMEGQQDKDAAIAEAAAAQERKLALKLKGEGEAAQILEMARGKAEAVKLEAEAEAEAIKTKADAKAYEVEKAKDPQYVKLRSIELQADHIKKWDGRYPTMMLGGNSEGIMLNMPIPAAN
jgi:hypothetical protein